MKLHSPKLKKRKPLKRKLSTKSLRDLATRNGKYTAKLAYDRASKWNQCPPWVKGRVYKAIEKIYIQAQILSLTMQEKFEVDHVVPLYGEYIRGLHIPANLTIISKAQNRAKSNYFKVQYWSQGKKLSYKNWFITSPENPVREDTSLKGRQRTRLVTNVQKKNPDYAGVRKKDSKKQELIENVIKKESKSGKRKTVRKMRKLLNNA